MIWRKYDLIFGEKLIFVMQKYVATPNRCRNIMCFDIKNTVLFYKKSYFTSTNNTHVILQRNRKYDGREKGHPQTLSRHPIRLSDT